MTPGLARCFRYKRGTPSGTEGDMQSDQTPSANSRAADAEWPRHGGAQAAGHERRPPDRPAPAAKGLVCPGLQLPGNGSTVNRCSVNPGAAMCPVKPGSRRGGRFCRSTER